MDEKLLLLINREWTSPVLDYINVIASSLDLWMPILVIAVLILLVRGSFRMRACLVTVGLVIAVNDGLVSNSLKSLVDRPRPHQSHQDVRTVELEKAKPRFLALAKPLKIEMSRPRIEDVEGRSFPSSHTINVFSVAIVLAVFFGPRLWAAFVVAGVVAYSRIYTGSHWPSDVLISIFIALGSTLFLLAGVAWLWRTAGLRFAPAIHSRHPELFAA